MSGGNLKIKGLHTFIRHPSKKHILLPVRWVRWRDLTYMSSLGLEWTDCCVQLTGHSLDLIMEDYFSRCSELCWLRTFTIEEIIGWYSRFPKTQRFSIDWSAGDAFCPMEKDKRWTNEFFLIIWTFSQDFHLENCHIILEPSGIAHLWLTTPVLQEMKRTEWHPPPFFQWRLCVLSSCGIYTLDDH